MERTEWLIYIFGFLTVKGFRIPKNKAENFKECFPEISDELIEMVIEDE